MNMYKEAAIARIISERAAAKRDRGGVFNKPCDCGEYGVFPTLPFPLWLLWTRGVRDWRSMTLYTRWNAWLDYRVECCKLGYDWDQAELYGIHNY